MLCSVDIRGVKLTEFHEIADLPTAVTSDVSEARRNFTVDERLGDGNRHVLDDGNGNRLWHFDGIRSGNRHFHRNTVGNGHGAIYRDGDVFGDFDWVGFRHLNGVRTVDGHGVWYLKNENKERKKLGYRSISSI